MPKQQEQERAMSAHVRTRSSTRAASRALPLSMPLRAVAGAPPHQLLPSPRSFTRMEPPQQQQQPFTAMMMAPINHHQQQHPEPMDDDGESTYSYSSGDSGDGYDSQHYVHDSYDRHHHQSHTYNSSYSSAPHAPPTHAMASAAPSATIGAHLLAPYAANATNSRVTPDAGGSAVPATARKSYKPRKATHVVRRVRRSLSLYLYASNRH